MWHIGICGCWILSQWAICSGLQRKSCLPCITFRMAASIVRRGCLGRGIRSRAIECAANGRYAPDSSELRCTYLMIVDVERSRTAAIRVTVAPARSPSPIRSRWSSEKYLAHARFEETEVASGHPPAPRPRRGPPSGRGPSACTCSGSPQL